jgi:hypothetical protein
MTQKTINRTKKIVVPIFMVPFIICGIESIVTSNEFGMTDLIYEWFLIPIITLSTIMSAYWISLTDEFWDLYEGIDSEIGTIAKTLGKFLIWIPAMGLCFYIDFQGILSIYNRTVGEQNLINVRGQIIDKDHYRRRYYLEIKDIKLGRNIDIKIDKPDFESYNVGDQYSTERKIGALGLVYD